MKKIKMCQMINKNMVYKPKKHYILMVINPIFIILPILLFNSQKEKGLGIVVIAFILMGIYCVFELLWMFFGQYRVDLKDNEIIIEKSLFISFSVQSITKKDLKNIELLHDVDTGKFVDVLGFNLFLWYNNCIKFNMKDGSDYMLYIPTEEVYKEVKNNITLKTITK